MKQSERSRHLNRVVKWLFASGRIARGRFWLLALSGSIIFFALFTSLESLFGTGTGLTWFLYAPFYWLMLVISIQRYHDLGKSGWWLLLLLIPLIGLIWVPIELGFRKGISEHNRYGPDPTIRPDYMTVA